MNMTREFEIIIHRMDFTLVVGPFVCLCIEVSLITLPGEHPTEVRLLAIARPLKLLRYIHTYIHNNIHSYIHTYIHNIYIHTFIHAYILYIPTYIHTNILI